MVDLRAAALLVDEVLHERAAELVAETCAWSVGLSDLPHWELRDGRLNFDEETGVSRQRLPWGRGDQGAPCTSRPSAARDPHGETGVRR